MNALKRANVAQRFMDKALIDALDAEAEGCAALCDEHADRLVQTFGPEYAGATAARECASQIREGIGMRVPR